MSCWRDYAFVLDEKLRRQIGCRSGGNPGISRPSLYAAFGDKQALFRAALGHYATGTAGYVAALGKPTARWQSNSMIREEALTYLRHNLGKAASGETLSPERLKIADLLQLVSNDCELKERASSYICRAENFEILAAGSRRNASVEIQKHATCEPAFATVGVPQALELQLLLVFGYHLGMRKSRSCS